jgi:hypothetical protein
VPSLLAFCRYPDPAVSCLQPFRRIFRFRNFTAVLGNLLEKLFIFYVWLFWKRIVLGLKQAVIELRMNWMSIDAQIVELRPDERNPRRITYLRMFHRESRYDAVRRHHLQHIQELDHRGRERRPIAGRLVLRPGDMGISFLCRNDRVQSIGLVNPGYEPARLGQRRGRLRRNDLLEGVGDVAAHRAGVGVEVKLSLCTGVHSFSMAKVTLKR